MNPSKNKLAAKSSISTPASAPSTPPEKANAGVLFQIPYRDQSELENIVEAMMVGYATALNDAMVATPARESPLMGFLADMLGSGALKTSHAAARVGQGVAGMRSWLASKISPDKPVRPIRLHPLIKPNGRSLHAL